MSPAALAALHSACFTMPRPWSAAEFAQVLAGPGVFLCLAEGSSLRTEGFLIGRALAGEAELLTLAVHPQARRQGIGARLVRDFLAEAARRGAARAFLEVAEPNAAARALYRSGGFVEAGRRRGYFTAPGHPAADALVLARDLPHSGPPAPDAP